MNSAIPVIELWQLSLTLGFVLMAGGASLWLGLGLGKDLLVGTVRTFGQLFLMGFILVHVFEWRIWWVTLAIFCGMIFFAAQIVVSRVKGQGVPVFWPILLSMLLSYVVISFLVVEVVVQAQPWWEPRIFLPMGSMIVGNSMNAMALSVERMIGEVKTRKEEIEALLSLGANPGEASTAMFRAAVRAGMIPSINSLMGVGLVFLPGMMTGQILGGADPLTAIKYQIVVMTMIVGSTALGSVVAVALVRRKLFNHEMQLNMLST